ncbi:MAG: family tricarboxylate transporter, receptor protein [Hyphomicrobiales bacterium]|jgi:tripartite-type tricarboxylate transporter receptor subunit TctC|nr:family tricarboxylate transporter, receptor protein [Hyphomicrobiales bacterium]
MDRRQVLLGLGAAGFFNGIATPSSSAQDSVEAFYKGRTVTLFVPTAPGGINDISARLTARHMGRFLPGAPNIVVQNIPGGGGLVAANRLYNTAERDGSVISIIQRGTMQLAIQGHANAKFDPMRFTWLGSLSSYEDDAYLLLVNADHPAKTAADLKKTGVVVKLGGDQPGSTNLTFAIIAKTVLGLNVDVVRGYPGAAPMFLAMQRGEIDGQVIGYHSVRAGQPHLWDNKKVRPLVQFGRVDRLSSLPDVPTGRELAPDARMRALLEFAELPFFMALPFLAPPDVPAERAAALQKAFMDMTRDADFKADAEKMKVDLSPIDGAAVKKLVAASTTTPKDVIALYNELVPVGN